VPRIPGVRLAWIDGGEAGGDASLIAAARAGHASDLGTVAERRVGTRRVLAVSRSPQHIERDLLLIEAEGLAPIGLVLVLVGVRLFERAGRRHRKQLETIVDAAQRIGDGERDVVLVAGRSEVGRVAGSLEQLAQGLRDLDRERGLYVSQVSHDLRNPLAVIGTYASVLRRGERSRPRAAQLQTIEDEVSRLALMVDDLLELGRTHALALHIQLAPADVRTIVTDAVAAARVRAGPTRVLLLAPAGAMPALVDAQRLRQAIDNLLDNAIRHAWSEVRVELACEAARELVLGVEDDGPGVDRELLPRLFEAFAQGADRIGGAGMGLSTVRAIAEAHGGGISVGVARERGARFTLRLPLTQAETIVS
jgi:signal transduction histidine kinase